MEAIFNVSVEVIRQRNIGHATCTTVECWEGTSRESFLGLLQSNRNNMRMWSYKKPVILI